MSVPIEIRQYYARDLDLVDLNALLRVCKGWKTIVDEDLGFQRICMNNTP